MTSRTWFLPLVLLCAAAAFAQLNTGTITGTVTDSSGALIPDVKVTVRNTATNVARGSSTSSAGVYTVSDLIVGPYEVTFESPAFKKLVRTGITLDVTQVVRVDGKMEVGAVTESVLVSSEVAQLQTENAKVSTAVQNRLVDELPLVAP